MCCDFLTIHLLTEELFKKAFYPGKDPDVSDGDRIIRNMRFRDGFYCCIMIGTMNRIDKR